MDFDECYAAERFYEQRTTMQSQNCPETWRWFCVGSIMQWSSMEIQGKKTLTTNFSSFSRKLLMSWWVHSSIWSNKRSLGGKRCEIRAISVPIDMHEGTLTPADVSTTIPSEIGSRWQHGFISNNVSSVLWRVVPVCLDRSYCTGSGGDDDLQSSSGKPKNGQRYRWRYWDKLGNVDDDHSNKWRAEFNFIITRRIGRIWLEMQVSFLGIFGTGLYARGWGTIQRRLSVHISHLAHTMSKQMESLTKTLLRSFWDCIWTWKHEGSIRAFRNGISAWRVFVGKVASCLILDKTLLDRLVSLKGWGKIEISQTAVAGYTLTDWLAMKYTLNQGKVERPLSWYLISVRKDCLSP